MYDIIYSMGRERQKDLLREAAIEREANSAIRNNRRNNKPLARVGRGLTRIGNQLIELSGEKN